MSTISQDRQSLLQTQTQFAEEFQAVEEKLALAFAGLYPPLSGLIRSQVQQAKPHLRAAVVLATATRANEAETLREKRIFLASALEMLYIALNVHQLLLNNSEQIEDTIDKSVLGSTILAGDYCFSHAASLAAQTDSPEVVALFSQTLQSISERQLRALFANDKFGNTKFVSDEFDKDDKSDRTEQDESTEQDENSRNFDASPDLFQAGLSSAIVLAHLDATTVDAHQQLVTELTAQLLHNTITLAIHESTLTPFQQKRWEALVLWRNQSV